VRALFRKNRRNRDRHARGVVGVIALVVLASVTAPFVDARAIPFAKWPQFFGYALLAWVFAQWFPDVLVGERAVSFCGNRAGAAAEGRAVEVLSTDGPVQHVPHQLDRPVD
jgi:hypothetical protein